MRDTSWFKFSPQRSLSKASTSEGSDAVKASVSRSIFLASRFAASNESCAYEGTPYAASEVRVGDVVCVTCISFW